MRILVVISLFLAVASAQFFPGFPFKGYGGFSAEDQYAASLSEAPVGLYDKKNLGKGAFGRGSDVSGASLSGAPVGIYGKENPRQAAPAIIPYPAPVPIAQPYPLPYQKPVRPIYTPPRYAPNPGYRPQRYGSRPGY